MAASTYPYEKSLRELNEQLDGSCEFDGLAKLLYSTDASVYQTIPQAVAFPKSTRDIQRLIEFAGQNGTSLIPRGAGTSLAGQVVGKGIVVDVGKHFTRIGPVDVANRSVVVQPGVVRDELNLELANHGLMFGPETSTSNRAMIGGMVGNNSCGSNSIVFGTTRDQTLEVTGLLGDGSEVTFGPLSNEELQHKLNLESLEGQVYRKIVGLLKPQENRSLIAERFPKPSIHRRNTGYAIDALMKTSAFDESCSQPLNLSKLVVGSEGTLFFATSIKLQLHELPPRENVLLCAHFASVDQALRANVIAMKHNLYASELIDRFVLEGAARNPGQRENLEFVDGTPGAILVLSLRGDTAAEVDRQTKQISQQLIQENLGYAFPVLRGSDISRVWELRKAGLGVIGNVRGDEKPVAVIEDTAVSIEDLPGYIRDVDQLLRSKYNCQGVYYAHAGSGEIHVRPSLNLKSQSGVKKFRDIATDVAELVRKYKGSLSGEHGDGRARSEFIESMIGAECFEMLREIKNSFDPNGIFNPGKIVDAEPMDAALRFEHLPDTVELETVFDFEDTDGIQRAAEMCTGSGDCRKSALIGGTMCPSFMATRDEKHTTRARANVLRVVIADSQRLNDKSPLTHEHVRETMDLCLACKGCKRECPSNVDIGKMKAEALQAWHDRRGVPLRTRLITGVEKIGKYGAMFPAFSNFVTSNPMSGWVLKKLSGIATKRSLPKVSVVSLRQWFRDHVPHSNAGDKGTVIFFADEFTSYTESQIGIAAIELLERLGWSVEIPDHLESGRALISQGLLRRAGEIASENVKRLSPLVSDNCPVISVEPSAILTFRDEYIDLLRGEEKEAAKRLAENCLTFEEFIDRQIESKMISTDCFSTAPLAIRLHGHCHEKAIVGLVPTIRTLQLPCNHKVRLIPSGCCGMAGSFGYESEHFDVSMQIGELVLFPTIRKEADTSSIATTGTSCRHQIKDGTGKLALHPAQILRDAFIDV